MKTYYLIDYENVNDSGFNGADQLTGKERVHVFSSPNAPYFNLNALSALKNAVCVHKVPAGKESVDMNLVSYLGYLIHKNKGKNCIYIIVSHDKGYDRVIRYWKEEKGIVIGRRSSFEIKVEEKTISNKKMKINVDVMKVLSKAKENGDNINGVASVVSKNCNEKKRKQVIYLALLSKYGRQEGLRLYNLIKHLL